MKLRSIFGGIVIATLLLLGSAAAVGPHSGGAPAYLALGDSVTFGYITEAGWEYFYPTNFVGFVDWTGLGLSLNVVSASCPGETTGSFLSRTAPDNGCREYRSYFPLHVVYGAIGSTQLAFATGFLRQGGTALVTVMLGANDLLLLEQECNDDPTCIENGAPQVFATAEQNMATILADLRATGYSGTIEVVNYYSTDYSNQFVTTLIQGLNQAITAPAQTYGAVVADVFSAFQAAASTTFAQGNTCVAGLLSAANPQTSPPTCNIHPSQFGHKLIAQVVAQAAQSPQRNKRQ